MKATWRAKFNALSAMNDGHQFITIKRYNNTYIVYLSDILETRNGKKVPEYEETYKYQANTIGILCGCKSMTFTDLMNYNK